MRLNVEWISVGDDEVLTAIGEIDGEQRLERPKHAV